MQMSEPEVKDFYRLFFGLIFYANKECAVC
jgi:hypothetical protein